MSSSSLGSRGTSATFSVPESLTRTTPNPNTHPTCTPREVVRECENCVLSVTTATDCIVSEVKLSGSDLPHLACVLRLEEGMAHSDSYNLHLLINLTLKLQGLPNTMATFIADPNDPIWSESLRSRRTRIRRALEDTPYSAFARGFVSMRQQSTPKLDIDDYILGD